MDLSHKGTILGRRALREPSPEFQLEFLRYLQRLLEEGEFVATYKFALLMALADLSVEKGTDTASPLSLTSEEIAEKFIQYYWPQSRPYVPSGREIKARTLWQNTGRQARVVSLVRETSEKYGNKLTSVAGDEKTIKSLTRRVASTVKTMPLWKLQVIGGTETHFLYENVGKGDHIEMKPGIAFCFRRFHAFVQRMAQNAWIEFIRRCKQNQQLLGEGVDLGEFLFGSQRATLDVYRPLLQDLQGDLCFYCCQRIRESEVDHFIPWSRYSTDLGHNFVLACSRCNRYKRDILPARQHLDRWIGRNMDERTTLEAFFNDQQIVHDLHGSFSVAHWAYGQAVRSHGRAWIQEKETTEVLMEWLHVFDRIQDLNQSPTQPSSRSPSQGNASR